MMQLRRKLYRRGSSYETTIPMPLLFSLDPSQKHSVVFRFDSKQMRWYIEFEPIGSGERGKPAGKARQQDSLRNAN